MRLTMVAFGQPAPQGSERQVGKGVMVELSKKLPPWRQDVKAAAEAARTAQAPLDGPTTVRKVFTPPKPLSAPERRGTWPCRTPDLSKLVRSTEDAPTDAGLWRDDARVVGYRRLAKVYPGEDPEALTAPGLHIVVEPMPDHGSGENAGSVPANHRG